MSRPTMVTVRSGMRELAGAMGDLGTLLPLMIGAIAVAGLAPVPVLLGFAVFYVATGLYYRLPIPVQPMKAIAAVLLTAELAPAGLAASGVLVGAVLLVLGMTGWIDRIARIVPQSVLAGLQLGLGLALALVAIDLLATNLVIGLSCTAAIMALLRWPFAPAALVGLAIAVLLGQVADAPGLAIDVTAPIAIPALPTMTEIENALSVAVLPQLSLTFTNAVLLTALLAGDYYGKQADRVTPTRLCLSSGLANIVLTPFGALPMCHGAGGLAAHYRFGARTGLAPVALGLVLFGAAMLPDGLGISALAAIPAAGLGALLLVAAGELALTRRLFDSRPSCWPVIAATAALTLWMNPFWGLLAGGATELIRSAVLRAARRRSC